MTGAVLAVLVILHTSAKRAESTPPQTAAPTVFTAVQQIICRTKADRELVSKGGYCPRQGAGRDSRRRPVEHRVEQQLVGPAGCARKSTWLPSVTTYPLPTLKATTFA